MPQLRQLEDPISIFAEVVSRLSLSVLSMAADVNLFKEDIDWKDVVWGDIRPVQAMIFGVVGVCLPPRFHLPPNQLWATTAWVPIAADPSGLQQRPAAWHT